MSEDGSGLRSSTNSVLGEVLDGVEYTQSELVFVHFPQRGFASSHCIVFSDTQITGLGTRDIAHLDSPLLAS